MKIFFKKSTVLAFFLCFGLGVMGQTKPKFKKPARETFEEKLVRNPIKNENLFKNSLNKMVPDNIILPGEFEESQAVAISWSFDYDFNGNPSGIDLTSVYADVSAQLADAIQQECTVWIRVLKNSDTTLVLNNMISRKTPLFNYKFIVANGDDWWTRDYGPMAFYSKNLDSIGFVDMKYYDGRDYDNVFPSQLANAMGYENYVTQLNSEGGNLMGDGFGSLFFSDVIRTTNADNSIHSSPWTTNQTYDTLKRIFNTPNLSDLVSLKCDGGTGHIDLYVKLIDEQTLIVAQYPNEITANDKNIIEDNYQYLSGLKSTYNRPFRILRVEHPTDDNGNHTRKNCTQIDQDARNFINGLTVNGSFIFPSYYDGVSGNAAQHQRIMEYYKRIMPGYKIVPIDSRELSPLGGAIHCITMQIPVENPIRFWHPSWDGLVPALDKYHLVSKITNQSGIQEAKCYWKKNNASTWNSFNLTDSSGYWIGDISNAGLQDLDSLSYYIEAKSNNGKTSTKPLNANKGGYYVMKLKYATGLESNTLENNTHLFNAWPNPAKETIQIGFKLVQTETTSIRLMNLNGQIVYENNLGETQAGMHKLELNVSEFKKGMYIYQLLIEGSPIMSKKLIIE
jgi:agmatine/peptidylarginine deiminase